MIPYRPYQSALVDGIIDAWSTARNTLAVLPTGGGKTVVFAGILAGEREPSIAIAHRQELVGQMSMALARCKVSHRIIAPDTVIKRIIRQHVAEMGASYYNDRAPCAVAGVDTLLNRSEQLIGWLPRVKLWVVDEAHHLLKTNKWGKAVNMFPNARGLGVTATPTRASGEGLGSHSDGLFDQMVIGPSMRELIDDGWLTDYRIFAPQSDVDLSTVTVSNATGDFNPTKLKKAIRSSHIIGDVVTHYQRIAPGKMGVTFASDVETATDIAAQFNAADVPAEIVSANTPDEERAAILHRYRNRELLMLVNVDLFGEGFDLPAIEVVIMARPTESFALYCQQFGRALRLMLDGPTPTTRAGRLAAIATSRKPRAIIIDHVGNVVRHGLPDAPREWTLDPRDRRSRGTPDDAVPLRACLNVTCMQVYERFLPECPYCGHHPEPSSRSAPEFVDGDLTELDPAVLAAMRGEVARVDMSAAAYQAELAANHCPPIGQRAHVKRHLERQEVQQALRASMAWWAGHHQAKGRSDAESYRRFYHQFGIDALSAQALGPVEASALAEKINRVLTEGVE
jgi:superfamily II DNA or RNA helicase